MKLLKLFLPLALFLGIGVFLFMGLSRDPKEIPSPLIGKSAPAFSLPLLVSGKEPNTSVNVANKVWSPDSMAGKVWLLNIWGSWCAACITEHPLLMELSKNKFSPEIIGIAWKDDPANANAWLAKNGNPFTQVIFDRQGKVAIDYGVYGAPETFLIDKKGIVRAKHIGALTQQVWAQKLLPLSQKLASE